MTLEDISVLFGDPVELSFEQALHSEQDRGERTISQIPDQEKHHGEGAQVENVDKNASPYRTA